MTFFETLVMVCVAVLCLGVAVGTLQSLFTDPFAPSDDGIVKEIIEEERSRQ